MNDDKELTVQFRCENCGKEHEAYFPPRVHRDHVYCDCGVVYTVPRPTYRPGVDDE